MAKNVAIYEEWKKLSWDQKVDIENEIWAVDFKKGVGIRKAILNDFKRKYANQKGILKIRFGWYKYILRIIVTIEKGYKLRLPHKFDIFNVERESVSESKKGHSL